jgi:hypothetical protein
MQLIIKTRPRENGVQEIQVTATIVGGVIVSDDGGALASLINGGCRWEYQQEFNREPSPEELLEYSSKKLCRASIIGENPVANKLVKKTIRHGKDEQGLFSIITETTEE